MIGVLIINNLLLKALTAPMAGVHLSNTVVQVDSVNLDGLTNLTTEMMRLDFEIKSIKWEVCWRSVGRISEVNNLSVSRSRIVRPDT